ncbi:hypothetical protein LTR56_025852 [Elasticomyces elasticus]|nr:hypothetical protein LTR56_025852 [Elasticomyces elasticus]KAK3665374.1 hypothetical protein LTR22_003897 [Elasticomyces elasticus]KAK4929651.1 hypothetical protein LTR49_003608 [Elasticomyces elasticus]KAK5761127.1 hypothetical protein LTS12_008805 [Elasticomyces elasticus]
MAEESDIMIKGAAEQSEQPQHAEETEQIQEDANNETTGISSEKVISTASASNGQGSASPQGEDEEEGEVTASEQQDPQYSWCKIYFEPQVAGAQNYYFMHFISREVIHAEPTEPYWIWDALTNNVHASGLQQPSTTSTTVPPPATSSTAPTSSEPEPEYQGYNPSIHGNYDPNADYAKYHEQKHAQDDAIKEHGSLAAAQQAASYAATATFNRFSGGFQTADKSTERHNDFNKSGRQMNAFFDVDAAANAHQGKSLKDERREQKLTKKEVQDMNKRRKEKKEKKRMDFYKS